MNAKQVAIAHLLIAQWQRLESVNSALEKLESAYQMVSISAMPLAAFAVEKSLLIRSNAIKITSIKLELAVIGFDFEGDE